MNNFLGYKGIFLCYYIITLCIYTKIYILAWTDNKTNKDVALNMRFPKVFKMLMVFSYLYIGGLVYIYISADDFTTIMSSVNVNIRMYNFDDVQCTVIPSVAYGFVTGMNLQLC